MNGSIKLSHAFYSNQHRRLESSVIIWNLFNCLESRCLEAIGCPLENTCVYPKQTAGLFVLVMSHYKESAP